MGFGSPDFVEDTPYIKIELDCAQGKISLNKKSERTSKCKYYMIDF